jgi:hypothetical protein
MNQWSIWRMVRRSILALVCSTKEWYQRARRSTLVDECRRHSLSRRSHSLGSWCCKWDPLVRSRGRDGHVSVLYGCRRNSGNRIRLGFIPRIGRLSHDSCHVHQGKLLLKTCKSADPLELALLRRRIRDHTMVGARSSKYLPIRRFRWYGGLCLLLDCHQMG